MEQFDTIVFGITFKNYFGQFVWIEKVTIIVAFHFMKRRLKINCIRASFLLLLIVISSMTYRDNSCSPWYFIFESAGCIQAERERGGGREGGLDE